MLFFPKAKNFVVNIRKELYDVFIGRPGPFGNPFVIGKDGSRLEVIEKFRQWSKTNPEFCKRVRRELKGKVLGCFCKPAPCHGDVLVEIANSEGDFK